MNKKIAPQAIGHTKAWALFFDKISFNVVRR